MQANRGQGVSLVHDFGLPPEYGVEPIQVRSVDTTMADAFVGKSVDVLKKPLLHEAHLRRQVARCRCWPETKTTLMGSLRGLSVRKSRADGMVAVPSALLQGSCMPDHGRAPC
jgi:hypothetical protein